MSARRRVVVAGGTGFFGRAAIDLLRQAGLQPLAAARRGPPRDGLRLDVEDPASLRAGLREGDLVLDAAGPFQRRGTALLEAAIALGFDLVDLSDSLAHARATAALAPRIAAAGIRVLPSCSSASAVSAALVARAAMAGPVGARVILAPATRWTASGATLGAFFAALGGEIGVHRGGELRAARAWSARRSFHLPAPVGPVEAGLLESADALWLPLRWPSLREVEFYLAPRMPGVGSLVRASRAWPALPRLAARAAPLLAACARRLGPRQGAFGVELQDDSGRTLLAALAGGERSYLTAVVPAALAVARIDAGRFAARGLVPPGEQFEPGALIAELARHGLTLSIAG